MAKRKKRHAGKMPIAVLRARLKSLGALIRSRSRKAKHKRSR
jgi:hypothetical protein